MGLRVLGVQLDVHPGAPEANALKMLRIIEDHAKDFDLFVFPEMAVPGYFVGDCWEQKGFLDRCLRANEQIIAASSSTPAAIIFGTVGLDGRFCGEDGRPRLYNAACIAQKGKRIAAPHLDLPFWPKALLPNYRVFEDSRHFYDLRRWSQDCGLNLKDATRPAVLQFEDGVSQRANGHPRAIAIGVTICEDLWSDDYSYNPFDSLGDYNARSRADGLPPLSLIVNLSASPFTKGKSNKRHRVLAARQHQTAVPLLYVNNIGLGNNGKNILCFDGGTALCDGAEIVECPAFEPAFLGFEVPVHSGEAAMRILTSASKLQHFPIPTSREPKQGLVARVETLEDPGMLAVALRFTLQETCKAWGVRQVVLGASGGIDSALAAALFCAALGPDQVTLINMPSRHNADILKSAALELAQRLGTRYNVVPIEASVAQLKADLFGLESFRTLLTGPVEENLQARDRGRILAAAAAAMGGVFSCNANKTELTVGYGTLYGDLAGFLAPLGDLWKGDVYSVAQGLNGACQVSSWFERPPIPEASLTVTPSAELSEDHDVTAGKGDPLDYPYHDRLFRLWVESWVREDFDSTCSLYDTGELPGRLGLHKGSLPLWFGNRGAFVADLRRWWSLYQGLAAFKRVQAPPIVTLSRRALGLDHRESVNIPCSPLFLNS